MPVREVGHPRGKITGATRIISPGWSCRPAKSGCRTCGRLAPQTTFEEITGDVLELDSGRDIPIDASTELHTAVRRQAPRWIPGDFPRKSIGVSKIARVTAPGCLSGGPQNRCSSFRSLLHQRIHFAFLTYVVSQ